MRHIVIALAVLTLAFAQDAGDLAFADGGVLKIAMQGNPNTLDPNKGKTGEETNVHFLVFSGLTEIDEQGIAQPDLAESWEGSDDQKTWTFHLRKGVKWHHGREFDAEDVVTTVMRVLDKKTGSRGRSSVAMVDTATAVDRHTVRFTLKFPYAGFAEVFGDRQLHIVPRDRIDTLATEPSGTGPFKFKSFTPGHKIELVKNEDYFLPGLPKLDGVEYQIMPENAARMAAIESGEVHVLWRLPLESIDAARKNPELEVAMLSTATWDGLIMRNDQPPFNDARVRRAVQLAIDKRQMIDISVFGYGEPTHSPIQPGTPFFNDEIGFPAPDIAKAKALLVEAGYPDGFEIKLYAGNERPPRLRAAVALQQILRPIGIKVNVQRVPWDKFVSDIEGKAKFYTDGFSHRGTVDISLYSWYHSSGSWNAGLWHYSNPEVDRLLDAARAARTTAAQAEIYKEFQAVVNEDVPSVLFYTRNIVHVYRKNVRGIRALPMGWLDLKAASITG